MFSNSFLQGTITKTETVVGSLIAGIILATIMLTRQSLLKTGSGAIMLLRTQDRPEIKIEASGMGIRNQWLARVNH